MPFNSVTYYANKYRRQAREALDAAREGPPLWSGRSVAEWRASRVELARAYWRGYLSQRRVQRMNADAKAMRQGNMTAAAFIAKWSLDEAVQSLNDFFKSDDTAEKDVDKLT